MTKKEEAAAPECYFSMPDWTASGESSLIPDDFKGRGAILGLDWLSPSGPISLAVVATREDGGFDLSTRFWMLSEAFQALPPSHPCRGAFQKGPLALTVMQPVDDALDRVADAIAGLFFDLDAQELAFDPAYVARLMPRLMKLGVPCVEFLSTATNMSDPLMLLDGYVRERRVRHSDNPVMNWAVSNTVRRKSRRDDLDYPDRRSREEWIDGVTAALFALGRLYREKEAAVVAPLVAVEPPTHPPGDYAVVEISVHPTLIGRVEEVERFGRQFLCIEPIFCGALVGPVFLASASLDRVTPCSAEAAFDLERALQRRRAAAWV